jgi:hypothetical protein
LDPITPSNEIVVAVVDEHIVVTLVNGTLYIFSTLYIVALLFPSTCGLADQLTVIVLPLYVVVGSPEIELVYV